MPATHQHSGIAANNFVKTVDDWQIHSYDQAFAYLLSQGVPSRMTEEVDIAIAANVKVRYRKNAGYIAIVLYDTEIVRYYEGGGFSVDNGGWNTQTTSTRVNQFTPNRYVFGHKGGELSTRTRVGVISKLTHNIKLF